ncbi:MAG: hypothetical protein AAFX99_17875 [Myxococcota bacterium]
MAVVVETQRAVWGIAAAVMAFGLAGLVFAQPRCAHAQDDMTFEPEDTSLRTAVLVMESRGVRGRDRKRLVAMVEKAVNDYGGYVVVDNRELRRRLGNRRYRTMLRCATPDCFITELAEADLDRLILVELNREGGILTATLEINDIPDRVVLQFAVGATDNIRSKTFLDAPMTKLLDLNPPPLLDPNAIANKTLATTGPGDAQEGGGSLRRKDDDDEGGSLSPVWGYSAMGAGIAFIAVGAIFGLQADNTRTDIQAEPRDGDAVQDLINQGEQQQFRANVAYILGIAGLGTGALLWYLSGPDEGGASAGARRAFEKTPDTVQWNVGPSGVGVSIPY